MEKLKEGFSNYSSFLETECFARQLVLNGKGEPKTQIGGSITIRIGRKTTIEVIKKGRKAYSFGNG